jgi:hypothetical protein
VEKTAGTEGKTLLQRWSKAEMRYERRHTILFISNYLEEY